MTRRARALGLLAMPIILAGCPRWTAYLGSDCAEAVDAGADPSTCPVDDAGPDAGDGCECVQVPGKWFGPTWLWAGPVEQAPSCEGETFYQGYADFVGGGVCEVCTCEAPTGTCALPSALTVSTKACNLPGGSSTSFDAPASWDGQCDGATSAVAGVAHSLTIAPVTMKENECQPGVPIPAKVIPAHATTVGLGCHGQGWTVCGDVINSACIPRGEVPNPGFRLCILSDGDHECPPKVSFTEKHVFYERAEEACSACSCGPPVGSICKATVSVYEDGACAGPLVDLVSVSSVAPVCVDIAPPGQALGSKAAGPTTYLPGMCQPQGGQSSGVIAGVNPSTLCCRP